MKSDEPSRNQMYVIIALPAISITAPPSSQIIHHLSSNHHTKRNTQGHDDDKKNMKKKKKKKVDKQEEHQHKLVNIGQKGLFDDNKTHVNSKKEEIKGLFDDDTKTQVNSKKEKHPFPLLDYEVPNNTIINFASHGITRKKNKRPHTKGPLRTEHIDIAFVTETKNGVPNKRGKDLEIQASDANNNINSLKLETTKEEMYLETSNNLQHFSKLYGKNQVSNKVEEERKMIKVSEPNKKKKTKKEDVHVGTDNGLQYHQLKDEIPNGLDHRTAQVCNANRKKKRIQFSAIKQEENLGAHDYFHQQDRVSKKKRKDLQDGNTTAFCLDKDAHNIPSIMSENNVDNPFSQFVYKGHENMSPYFQKTVKQKQGSIDDQKMSPSYFQKAVKEEQGSIDGQKVSPSFQKVVKEEEGSIY